jgi:hypothetical protein
MSFFKILWIGNPVKREERIEEWEEEITVSSQLFSHGINISMVGLSCFT